MEKRAGLLGIEVRNVDEQPFDRLPFVWKQVAPLMELLIDEGKKCERQVLENALIQCLLDLPGIPVRFHHIECPELCGHTALAAGYARNSVSFAPCVSIGLHPRSPASVGQTST